LLSAVLSSAIAAAESPEIRLDDPAIQYLTRPLNDPVAELNRQVQSGRVTLRYDGAQGYLRSVLDALHVPLESQIAVFSKTSVQRMRIDPQHPRVLYFNDSVVVGWVPNGSLELAALDPRQGMIFYTVDQRPWVHQQRGDAPPSFDRRTDCLSCHISRSTHGIPGALLRSVTVTSDGTPVRGSVAIDTDLRTPFDKLWGGWYVTGSSGSARHMGSAVQKIGNDAYLSPYSDIVALLVFEHQAHMMNLLIEAGWKARAGLSWGPVVNEVVDYLLFVDEPLLPSNLKGSSGFDARFAAQGPLRQFDLKHRLMRYPCSYLIYSQAFDALPTEVKDSVYRRMWQILSGAEKDVRYARLSREDRAAVVAILRETKRGLPEYFGPLR
jgi:hypothetical protein